MTAVPAGESVPAVRIPAQRCGHCLPDAATGDAVREQRVVACRRNPTLVCRAFVDDHWSEVAPLRAAERHGLVVTVTGPDDPGWLSQVYAL